MAKREPDKNVAAKVVWDEHGVFVSVTESFKALPIGEQWTIMRAAQRALDRIMYNLTDLVTDNNRRGGRE